MSALDKAGFEANKGAIKERLTFYLEGRDEVGLEDLKRDLYNNCRAPHELSQAGHFIAKLLNGLGWRRDGHLGTGYDRQPRYLRVPA